MDAQMRELVAAIISRLSRRLGADGSRGHLLTLFTGATADVGGVLDQVRRLILDGYRIDTVFSPDARRLVGTSADDRLLGFPHVHAVDAADWMGALDRARAVVVPLLSLSTAAKVAGLVTDTVPATIVVRALASGTPVVAVADGARITNRFWCTGVPAAVPAALQAAADRHLETLNAYGCLLSTATRLRLDVNRLLGARPPGNRQGNKAAAAPHRAAPAARVVTAAHVRRAQSRGNDLYLQPDSVVTPLARDIAARHGIGLIVAGPPTHR